jgi:hypothetical protein
MFSKEKRESSILKYLMTLTVIAINILRKPELLSHPRFYAEEGRSFFAAAYNSTLLDYILTPMYGYYALYNVIATSIATLPELELAPLITTYLALFVQISTSAYVIWCNIPILNSNSKRFMVAISFPLLCPHQIWLTTIGIQYWLCIVTTLILLEDSKEPSGSANAIKAMALILTGLTGVLSYVMTPFFLLKWLITKSKKFFYYYCVLCVCTIIQFYIFIQAGLSHDAGLSNRFIAHTNSSNIMYTNALNFLGNMLTPVTVGQIPVANRLYVLFKMSLFNVFGKHGYAEEEAVFILTSIIVILSIVMLVIIYRRSFDYLILPLSSAIVFFLSVKLSINSSGGPRYLFAPSAMLMIFLVASCNKNMLNKCQLIFLSSVIAVIIMVHANDFTPSMGGTYTDKWPKWEEEVRLWRIDNSHPLKIWPPPWEMNLNKPPI